MLHITGVKTVAENLPRGLIDEKVTIPHLIEWMKDFVIERLVFCLYVTLLCNRPSGIYILTGFSEKTSPGRQIIYHGAPFCEVNVLPFSSIH